MKPSNVLGLRKVGYQLMRSTLTVNIPIIGDISLKDVSPDAGNTIDSAIGSATGEAIA